MIRMVLRPILAVTLTVARGVRDGTEVSKAPCSEDGSQLTGKREPANR